MEGLSMRFKINVTGIVQGVGFRPFIYRIAVANGLSGYVRNRGDAGVEILLEGTQQAIDAFLRDLRAIAVACAHSLGGRIAAVENEARDFEREQADRGEKHDRN